jgi:hypothetical protein
LFNGNGFGSSTSGIQYIFSRNYHILDKFEGTNPEPVHVFFNVFGTWNASSGPARIIIEPSLSNDGQRTFMKITRFGFDGLIQGFTDTDGVFKQTFDNIYYQSWLLPGEPNDGSARFGWGPTRFTLVEEGTRFDGPAPDGTQYFLFSRTNSLALPSAPAPVPVFGSPAPSPIFGSPAPSPIFGSPAPAPPRPYFEPLFTVDAGTSTLRESGNEIVLVPSGDSDNRYYLRKVTNTNDDYPIFNVLFPGVTLPNTNVEEIYLRIDNTYITRVIYENSQEPFRYGFYSDLYGNSGQPVGGYPDPTTPIRKIEIGRIQRDTSIFSGFTVQYEIGPGSDYYIQVVNSHKLSYTQDCVIDFYNLSNGGEWYQDIFERNGNPIPNLNDSLRYSHVLIDDRYLLELYKPFLQGRVNIIAGHADRNRNLINNDFGKGNSPSYRIVTTSLKFGNFTGRTTADQTALPLFGRDVIPHPAVSNWDSGDNRNYTLTSQNGQWYLISTENWVTWNRFYYSSYDAMLEIKDGDQKFHLRNEFASDFEDIFINGTRTKARSLSTEPKNPNNVTVLFWYVNPNN